VAKITATRVTNSTANGRDRLVRQPRGETGLPSGRRRMVAFGWRRGFMGNMKLGLVSFQPRHLKTEPTGREPILPASSDRRRSRSCLRPSLTFLFMGLLSLPATAQDQPD